MKRFHRWGFISLVFIGLLLFLLTSVWFGEEENVLPSLAKSDLSTSRVKKTETTSPSSKPGGRKKLNYQQWVALLEQEAKVAAQEPQDNLVILLGDSLSLWFPSELLPPEKTWLNQGISGEGSAGLLRRLELLDATRPQAIFIMIGINDLIRGVDEETILANQELIIQYLKENHPQSKIFVQSILPHSGKKATWEGRDRLLEIPSERIEALNERLEIIAEKEEVIYLDLYSLFSDEEGYLKTELSTDGLHLNPQGYGLWRVALQVATQLEVDSL